MRVQHYRALLEPDSKGGYGVVFPDFPRCVSVGADAETAVHQAAEALALHIEGMLEDETTLPSPSAPDAPLPGWLADEPGTGRWVRVLVPVTVPGEARRINVTIEESLLARFDNAARDHRMIRSAFLADTVRRALAGT
jgi:predicted RNase H-like HicB family nuclease